MAKPHRSIPPLSEKDIERFWAKVEIKGPDDCWLWKAAKFKRGDGAFMIRNELFHAPRVAYVIQKGPLPDPNLLVCHNCPEGDNPACCNGKHLFYGSCADNMADASQKGRMSSGDRHWTRLYPGRAMQFAARGDRHGLHTHPEKWPQGWMLKRPEQIARGEKCNLAKLTEEQVKEIRNRYASGGISYTRLAHEYHVQFTTIGKIIRREIWAHVP